MICSGDFGFYEKRSLPPISVTNKRSRRTEIEKMSNFRNLFCMVAITSAPTCGLGYLILSSAPSSNGILTSAQCKRITCTEVNNLCRNSFVPKLMKFFEICAEVLVPKFGYPDLLGSVRNGPRPNSSLVRLGTSLPTRTTFFKFVQDKD